MPQTAMQELISAITSNGHIIINQTLVDTYLEKEKQNIEKSYNDGKFSYLTDGFHITAEQYYNEKYNKNK